MSLTKFLAQDCDYFVRVEEVYQTRNSIYSLIEFMDRGCFSETIFEAKEAENVLGMNVYSEGFCKWFLYRVLLGLNHMHSKDVIHRDLKSENILIDQHGKIKICDLGFSIYDTNNYRVTKRGTPLFLAPEILRQLPYN